MQEKLENKVTWDIAKRWAECNHISEDVARALVGSAALYSFCTQYLDIRYLNHEGSVNRLAGIIPPIYS